MNDASSDRLEAVSEPERNQRLDLALAYRVLHAAGVDDLTYNHLSARVPEETDAFLIKPSDFTFDEVTASGLFKYGLDGQPRSASTPPLRGGALVIHAGILSARPDINILFHTHTPANIAVSNHEQGLLPLSQHALLFHDRFALHAFQGLEFNPDMTETLLEDLGSNQVMLLRNHGVLIAADTVAEAVVLHHFFEFACRAQVASLAGGNAPVAADEDVVAFAAAQYAEINATKGGGKDWAAIKRRASRLYPEYRE